MGRRVPKLDGHGTYRRDMQLGERRRINDGLLLDKGHGTDRQGIGGRVHYKITLPRMTGLNIAAWEGEKRVSPATINWHGVNECSANCPFASFGWFGRKLDTDNKIAINIRQRNLFIKGAIKQPRNAKLSIFMLQQQSKLPFDYLDTLQMTLIRCTVRAASQRTALPRMKLPMEKEKDEFVDGWSISLEEQAAEWLWMIMARIIWGWWLGRETL